MIRFIDMKNQHILGYIDDDQFLLELKELDKLDLNEKNSLTVKLNIIQYKLLAIKGFVPLPEELLSSIEELFNEIREKKFNSRVTGLYLLWNCENLSLFASLRLTLSLGEIQIRESLGEPIPIEDRVVAARRTIDLEGRISFVITEVATNALRNEDKLVATFAYALDVRHFLSVQIKLISFDINLGSEMGNGLSGRISNATKAYNTLLEFNLFGDAYSTLCNLINLVELADNVYQTPQHHKKDDLYKAKEDLELRFEIPSREIAIVSVLEKKSQKKVESNNMSFCKEMDNDQIEFLAGKVLKSLRLPPDRLVNIIEELKAYRMFYQRCTNSNVEVLQVRSTQDYSSPIFFSLRSLATGIQTPPKKDMNALLEGWGF